MKELNQHELIEINGGGDNRPVQRDRTIFYYIGYAVGWLFD